MNFKFPEMVHNLKNFFRKPYLSVLTLLRIIQFSWPDFECMLLLRKVRQNSMVSEAGLVHLFRLARSVEKRKISGAFVECGVWKGGCAAILGYVAQKAGDKRSIWLFDSFQGVPEPTVLDGQEAASLSGQAVSGKLEPIGHYVGAESDVRKLLFNNFQLSVDSIHIEKGWFQDTLPDASAKIGPIAILRLDGDWYESTKICLDSLYDLVVPGGYVVVDDYGHWEGCKKAVDEFFVSRRLSVDLQKVNYTIHFFQKPFSDKK